MPCHCTEIKEGSPMDCGDDYTWKLAILYLLLHCTLDPDVVVVEKRSMSVMEDVWKGWESFHSNCQYASHPDAKIYSIHFDTKLDILHFFNIVC